MWNGIHRTCGPSVTHVPAWALMNKPYIRNTGSPWWQNTLVAIFVLLLLFLFILGDVRWMFYSCAALAFALGDYRVLFPDQELKNVPFPSGLMRLVRLRIIWSVWRWECTRETRFNYWTEEKMYCSACLIPLRVNYWMNFMLLIMGKKPVSILKTWKNTWHKCFFIPKSESMKHALDLWSKPLPMCNAVGCNVGLYTVNLLWWH